MRVPHENATVNLHTFSKVIISILLEIKNILIPERKLVLFATTVLHT